MSNFYSSPQIEVKSEDDEKYKCGEVFMKIGEKLLMFVCTHCDETFKELDDFVKHLYDELENKSQDTNTNATLEPIHTMFLSCDFIGSKEPESEYGEDGAVKVESCAEDDTIHVLPKENATEHNEKTPKKNSSKLKKQLETAKPKKNSTKTDYKCELCSARFANKHNLVVHRRRHVGEKPYSCDFCPSAFSSSTSRKVHMSIHTGDLPHICEECGKRYVNGSKLREHRRRAHLKQKDFKCDTCGKEFIMKWRLRDHISAIHSNAPRDKICDVCKAAFKTSKHLGEHKKIHREKTYLCKICTKAFAQFAGLYMHMKTHGVVKKSKETLNKLQNQL